MEGHSNGLEIVGNGMAFVVGNGRRVKFWLEKWCEDEPLRSVFPSLFAIAVSKEAWVEEVPNGSFEGGCWAPHFVRLLNNWELDEVESFILRLQGKRIHNEEDELVCVGAKDGGFTVKQLNNTLDPGRHVDFPSRVIWNSLVPSKVGMFAWVTSWSNILTLDKLQRRGWVMANICYLCGKQEESSDHILIHYDMTNAMWNLLISSALSSSSYGERGAS